MSEFDNRMVTPLKRVRGLGSAHEGTMHFWRQRLTGIALVPLTLFFVGLIIALSGADYATTRSALANPFVALTIALMLIAGLVHMRLGMQSVIEDYVHGEGAKLVCL
ncbi:succinate dehydrogenase, hydrophobic membrane anchor protein, partial [Salmonella enterica subsp. enterica serovar Virchow]|nr:succinate dehydrogenase, hydrophobic membrane anchor protein [Salmonella enterica subsp. enterica serovar Virchow]